VCREPYFSEVALTTHHARGCFGLVRNNANLRPFGAPVLCGLRRQKDTPGPQISKSCGVRSGPVAALFHKVDRCGALIFPRPRLYNLLMCTTTPSTFNSTNMVASLDFTDEETFDDPTNFPDLVPGAASAAGSGPTGASVSPGGVPSRATTATVSLLPAVFVGVGNPKSYCLGTV